MSASAILYATDEDVALHAQADFGLICPPDQVLAEGSDGSFSGLDRWKLSSASVDFAAAGVAPGHVVLLLGPIPPFRPAGEALTVAAVATGSLVLRRQGLGAGEGQPPGPSAGLEGIRFLVPTLAPQIAQACDAINRRLGVGVKVSEPGPEDVCGSAELRRAAVLAVLHGRYSALASAPGDQFSMKAEQTRAEFERVLGQLLARWACGGGPWAGRFGTRLSR